MAVEFGVVAWRPADGGTVVEAHVMALRRVVGVEQWPNLRVESQLLA